MNKDIVPASSKSSGNTKLMTKQISPSKKWCFTLNNYTEINIQEVINCKEFQSSKQYLFQEEIGISGTKHLQGFVYFNTKIRPLSLALCNKKIHWEKMKGTIKENIMYCSKENTNNGKSFYKGCKPFKPIISIKESNFYQWEKDLYSIIREPINDRSIIWVWEEQGKVGKSQFCKWLGIYESAVICAGSAKDMKYLISQRDEAGLPCDLILFDISRRMKNSVSYIGIEEIKNGFFCSSKYETRMTIINSPNIIVFCNSPPKTKAMSLDRWEVYKIINNELTKEIVN